MNNLIQLKNVSKNYFSSKKIEVLKNINYTFRSGKIYSLTGPSGSGKSTLLNLISLIDKPSSGFIKLNDLKINDNDNDQRDMIRSRKIGIIYQDKNLLADFSTLENVYLARLSLSNNKKKAITNAKNLLKKVGLDKINTISKKLNIYNEPIKILSYSLGSGETNLINLASAYASFVNGGKKISPTLIDHIQDQNGKTIFKNKKIECYGCNKDYLKGKPPTIKYNFEQVFSDSTAFQMVNILKGVVDRGTAKKIKNLNIELGGKTGTTNDNFDAWFIGFTPNVLIGVYVGFDEPATLGKKETGSKAALPIFRDIVKQLNLNTDRPFFKVPPSIKLEKIDVNSGKIVKSNSKNTIVEGFKINSMTKKTNSINPVNNGIY